MNLISMVVSLTNVRNHFQIALALLFKARNVRVLQNTLLSLQVDQFHCTTSVYWIRMSFLLNLSAVRPGEMTLSKCMLLLYVEQSVLRLKYVSKRLDATYRTTLTNLKVASQTCVEVPVLLPAFMSVIQYLENLVFVLMDSWPNQQEEYRQTTEYWSMYAALQVPLEQKVAKNAIQILLFICLLLFLFLKELFFSWLFVEYIDYVKIERISLRE
mmetsp:Transcript_25129/g.37136  ORF Transcript_25129/g.37136 Transcript_25129/m.37136 type:complete len:214 (-) Transcript_25129:116-757(-)